jgi:hypothetical protein
MEPAKKNMNDWDEASPQQLPRPTYFPFFFALSLLFVAWGLISLWVLALAGAIGMIASLGGWIGDMLAENKKI